MKKLIIFLTVFLVSSPCFAVDCSLIYDEFDSLMNKNFLVKPSKYVKTVSNRLSRSDYNTKQKGKFLLNAKHRGSGVAIVHTNKNSWGKLLFTWGKPIQNGQPSLVIKEVVLYGRVRDGSRPKIRRNITIKSSFTVDLDSGRAGGDEADIWFHNIDGKTMYIEAVNGASLKFPMQSLCKSQAPQLAARPRGELMQVVNPGIVRPVQPIAVVSPGGTTTAGGNSNGKTVVKREVLPNGHVLISYSDGSKVERFQGGMDRIAADGTRSSILFSTSAPAAIPVAAPGAMEGPWLEGRRHSLLNIIQSLVSDPSLVQQVLDGVDTSSNPYESIETRSKIIEQLVQP